MCDRRPNEPWWAYLFRMGIEQPRGVLAIIGLVMAALAVAGLVYLYRDTAARSDRQTDAYIEVGRHLEKQGTRLDAIDAHLRQLDIWHKQEYMTPQHP